MSPTTEYTTLDAARHWLKLGFHILPVQHGKKWLYKGFGIHQRHITTESEAKEYFTDGSANLAVIATGENFIIDFDSWNIYAEWAKSADESYTTSYTEITPHGAHVWLCGEIIEGLTLRDGIEIKASALVAPSIVDGDEYSRGHGSIYRGNVDDAFIGLTVPGTPTGYLLRARETAAAAKFIRIDGGPVQRIKESLNIAEVFSRLSPTRSTMRGTGRYISAQCPFHKNGREVKESFWLDTEKQLFGCHACNTHGDVINLYAKLSGQNVNEAIQTLKGEVVP